MMLPFYTAVLDTKDYGTFDLLVTYATLLLPLVNWQFDQGLFRFMLENGEITLPSLNCFQPYLYPVRSNQESMPVCFSL